MKGYGTKSFGASIREEPAESIKADQYSRFPGSVGKSGGAHFAPSLPPGGRLFQRFVLPESDGRGPKQP